MSEIKHAVKRGAVMASLEAPSHRLTRFVYKITNNPYSHSKLLHVAWHNSFYDECKRIGRGIR